MTRSTIINKSPSDPTLPPKLKYLLLWLGAASVIVGFIFSTWEYVEKANNAIFPDKETSIPVKDRLKIAKNIFDKRDTYLKIGCVDGNCDDGYGTVVKIDGTIYEGFFLNNLQHGAGTMVFPENHFSKIDFIICDFGMGAPSGEGYIRYTNGDFYEGEIRNYERNGKGRLHRYVTGRTEEGIWKDDLIEN